VLDSYQEGDVVQGTVTKVVTFGAFVEILPGVEGLVHISELAQHHVENPREIVSQGDQVNVRILEVDAERRRLSLSLKRVEDGMPVQPKPGEEGEPPALGLSDEVFADEVPAAEALEAPAADAQPVEAQPVPEAEPVAEAEAEVVEEEPAVAEPEPAAEEPVAEEEPATGAEAEAPEAGADASDEAAPE
jgi:small subunit ribosomal protein S1